MLQRLAQDEEDAVTTRLNVAELWVGVEKSDEPARELAVIAAALADLDVLELDRQAAEMFGYITADLARRGRPAGDMDVLIASVAVTHGHRVVTDNRRHFEDMPGVEILTY